MNSLESGRIVKRVISEVAGTISTNGIQELSCEERGGVSQFGYVRSCLVATAYNACRALPHFNHTYTEFWNAVEAETLPLLAVGHVTEVLPVRKQRDYTDAESSSIEAYWQAKQGEDYGSY